MMQCGLCDMVGKEDCTSHGRESTLRTRSGQVDDTRPLVAFLYILMRDHLTAGAVEEIMLKYVEVDVTGSQFTNGYLAMHAQDIAERLTRKG